MRDGPSPLAAGFSDPIHRLPTSHPFSYCYQCRLQLVAVSSCRSRMGDWLDNRIFYRDFGYSYSRRRILSSMAHIDSGDIGDTSAQTFAEYVVSVHDPRNERPSLLFRLHSDRLRVQANAKSLRERLLSGPLVDIYVGESKRHWALHRNLLAYHSDVFQEELQQQASESTPTKSKAKQLESSQAVQLDLPGVDPSGFELFVKWMYQGKVEDVSSISEPQHKYSYAVACYNLHRLCDKFDIPRLKNIAMDQYRKGLAEAELVPDAEEINDIYRKSSEGSAFRKLVTKIAARQIMDPESEKDAESYRMCFESNPDFAIDLVNAIKDGTGGVLFEDATEGNNCEFHDHSEGPNCHIRGKQRLGK